MPALLSAAFMSCHWVIGTSSSLEFHSDIGGVAAVTFSAADADRLRSWQVADLSVCGSQPRKARGPCSLCGLLLRKSRKSYPPDQPTAAAGVKPALPSCTPVSTDSVAPADEPHSATLVLFTSTRPWSKPFPVRALAASSTSVTCMG